MNKSLLSFVLLSLAFTISAQSQNAVLPSELRCEYLIDPLGIDVPNPRLSWISEGHERGWSQAAYRILVASSKKNLASDVGDLWDTKKVESDSTNQIEYAGKALESRMRCYWKVKVWDQHDRASAWSSPALWTVGLIGAGDWKARWIGAPPVVLTGERVHDSIASLMTPSPLLRKTFRAPKSVTRATLYATALGLYEVRLNGKKVGDHELAPEWTDYQKRIQYQAYDVSGLLRSGENVLTAMLADGWYVGAVGTFSDLFTNRGKNYGSLDRKLLLQLEIEPAGRGAGPLVVVSDESWRVNPDGPVRSADIYLGETFDKKKLPKGWDLPGFDDSGWERASAYPQVKAALVAQMDEPVRIIQELKPVALSEPARGTVVFDMGQNMVGWCAVTIDEPAGKEIRIRYGEMLDDTGALYTANLRSAAQTDRFISDGKGAGVYEPRFTYHGFRYVEITGLSRRPAIDAVAGKEVSSDVRATGQFECSNRQVNQLWKNIRWTQRDNLIGIPTDCPQRDERLGWMADAQVFSQTAILNCDMSAFYTKWAQDIRDAQDSAGRYPDVAPMGRRLNFYNAPAWADAGVIIPWKIYQNYGDKRLLKEHYPSAKRFIDFLRSVNAHLLWTEAVGNMYGDWLNGNTIVSDQYPKTGGQVPHCVFSTMYFAYSAGLLAKMAEVLGYREDAGYYTHLAGEIRDTLLGKFVSADAAITGNTQAGYALALGLGLLPDSLREKAFGRMLSSLADYDFRISTGFLSTVQMMNELARRGSSDIAYGLLESRRFPSWLYQIGQGATTVWERWDGYVKGRGFQDPGMNSFNHYAIGSVGEWMYRNILGIQSTEDSPGFRVVLIRPQIGGSLTWAKGKYHSINGDIVSAWRLDSGKASFHVEIPSNTTARVVIPTRNPQTVTEGGKSAETSPGVKFVGAEEGANVYAVQSGSYDFESEYSKPAPRTYAQKPAIRTAPRLDGDGNLTVSIESPDTSLHITYSLDLKGMGPSRPGKTTTTSYTRPFTVSGTALLSARTNASGCEPSFPALTYFDFDGGDSSGGDRPNLVIVHKAYGSSVKYAQPYSPNRPGEGPTSLVNGKSGSLDFEDPQWQGFEGIDVEAVVDLGKEIPVSLLSAGFLSYQSARIFLPTQVEFSLSKNGREFTPVALIEQPLERYPGVSIKEYSKTLPTTACRFLKVVARNVAQCPDWHPSKGRKAWLFIDEIVVR